MRTKSVALGSSLLIMAAVFVVPLSLNVSQVRAQTPCYTYAASSPYYSGQSTAIDLGNGTTLTIPNQATPSMLQEMIFPAANDSCAMYYNYTTDRITASFPTNTGMINSSGPWMMQAIDGPEEGSNPAEPGPLVYMRYFLAEIGGTGQTRIDNENKIIDNIAATHTFNLRIGSNSNPSTSDMSVPATNCAHISGSGSSKIIFVRDNSWSSSVSDFLKHAVGVRDQMLANKPYNVSPTQYSFYLDLKKTAYETAGLVTGASPSSCGAATEYRYVFPPPILMSASYVPKYMTATDTDPFLIVYGSGFAPNGADVMQVLSTTTSQPLYNPVVITKSGDVVVSDNQRVQAMTDFTLDTPYFNSSISNELQAVEIPDGSYLVRVAAKSSVWSNSVPILISNKPNPPKNLTAVADKKGQITLKWQEGSPRGNVVAYETDKLLSGGEFYYVPFHLGDDMESNARILVNYPPSTSATFKVRASYNAWSSVGRNDYSDYSNTVTVTTLPKTKAPVLYAVAGPDNTIVLFWTNSDPADVINYDIKGISSDTNTPETMLGAGDLTQTYEVKDATPGVQYCYNIVAVVNDNNKSDPSNTACVTAEAGVVDDTVSSPQPTTAVSNTDTFTLNDTGTSPISSVDLIVDGTKVSTDMTAPWSIPFDSTKFVDGPHQVYMIIHRPSPKQPIATKPMPIQINNHNTAPGSTAPSGGTTTNPSSSSYPFSVSLSPTSAYSATFVCNGAPCPSKLSEGTNVVIVGTPDKAAIAGSWGGSWGSSNCGSSNRGFTMTCTVHSNISLRASFSGQASPSTPPASQACAQAESDYQNYSPPAIVVGTVSGSQASIILTDPGKCASQYEVWKGDKNSLDCRDCFGTAVPAKLTSVGAGKYTFSGLTGSNLYGLCARSDLGGTFWKHSAPSCVQVMTPPLPVPVLSAVASSSSEVNLSWKVSKYDGIMNYSVYRQDASLLVSSTTNRSFTVNQLLPSTKYCYTVVPYASYGAKSSALVCATTQAPRLTLALQAKPPASSGLSTSSVMFALSNQNNVSGISSVDLYVNAVKKVTATTAPWNLTLDTRSLKNGSYSAYAMVTMIGNSSAISTFKTNTVSFKVANSATSTPINLGGYQSLMANIVSALMLLLVK